MERHRLDPLSLVAGLAFVVAGGAQLLGANVTNAWLAVARAWPLLLVIAGLVVLVRAARPTDDR